MTPSPARFPVLDGWRAIAIGLVIWHHATTGFYASESAYYSGSASQLGAFGVDIFFGLSGLLITALLLQEHAQKGSIDLKGFYTRRVFRIVPPCLVFLLVIGALGLIRSPLELASCLAFFRNYLPVSLGGFYTGHLWSLAVEEHFYLLWPALLVWLVARNAGARPVAYLSIFFGLWRVLDAQTGATARWLADVSPHFRTDLRADALLWGCVVAFLLTPPGAREKLRAILTAPVTAALAAIAVACVIVYSMLSAQWLAMLIPVVLAGTMLHPEWGFCRLLDLASVRFVGRISYSLYLWQELFLTPGWLPKLGFVQQWPWNLVATFAAATASYFLVEKPCMQLGRALAQRRAHESRVLPQEAQLVAGEIPNVREYRG
jgi:peptidoglycan/LPS O-acetylase OafA/YrhL